uniref:Uncharacterized protein n=1 Tax=Arundo donax TaxID=35708 RepID=A0A0A8YZV1_ARUDO
MSSLLAMHTGL